MFGRSLLLLTTNYLSKSADFIGQISTIQENSLQFFSLRWHVWCPVHWQKCRQFAAPLRHLTPQSDDICLRTCWPRSWQTVVVFTYPTPYTPGCDHLVTTRMTTHNFQVRYSQLLNLHVRHDLGIPGAWPRHTKTRGTLSNGNLDWLTCVFYVGMMLIYPPVI